MSGDFTLDFIASTLDALSFRQQIIAENIAHSSNAGYSAKKVNFEAQLQSIDSADDLKQFKAEAIDTHETVKIDHELGLSIQNTTQYRALIRGLNQKFAMMRLSVRGQ